jgi:hypothetical protein
MRIAIASTYATLDTGKLTIVGWMHRRVVEDVMDLCLRDLSLPSIRHDVLFWTCCLLRYWKYCGINLTDPSSENHDHTTASPTGSCFERRKCVFVSRSRCSKKAFR